MRKITLEMVRKFKEYLWNEEKSDVTVKKYIHDVETFSRWLGDKLLEKSTMLMYKEQLMEKYAPASVNSVLSSLNSFFRFNEWFDLRVKNVKVQRQMFVSNDKELTKAEYERLLKAAKDKKNEKLYLIMQTICSTGIRVGELKFVTVEAVNTGRTQVKLKGKVRTVFLPDELIRLLKKYIKEHGIKKGSVFVTRTGKPIDRHGIWKSMKSLCESAGVSKDKVFPHNLRHLFARTYYSLQKDIVRLADILGHSNVNTTRIYTIETGDEHRKQMQRLGLVCMRV